MNFRKAALLFLSGVGLVSVANYSAEIGTHRERKKVFLDKDFWVIAHRGFSGQYPENTMLAFEKAASLPIDAIELDIHSTRDGRIVVIHDPTLNRTTDRSGQVLNLSWDELKTVDAGYRFDPNETGEFPFRGKGVTVPLLEEVFQQFRDMKFIIEIKQTTPELEEMLHRLILKYEMQEKVIVASEHYEPLVRFRSLNSRVATNLSRVEAYDFYRLTRVYLSNFYRAKGDALQIPERLRLLQVVTPEFLKNARKKGLTVHIWTVNDPGDMKRLIDWGVNGIITDFPDRLLNVIAGGTGIKR